MIARSSKIIALASTALLFVALFATAHVRAQSSDAAFGAPVIAEDRTIYTFDPIDPMQVFPQGVKHLIGFVSVSGLPDNSEVTSEWFQDGTSQGKLDPIKTDSKTTQISSRWESDAGLDAGSWEVRFTYNGNVVAKAIAKVQAGAFVYPMRFGDDCTFYTAELFDEQKDFGAAQLNVAARIRYANLPQDSKLEIQWYLAGTDILESSDTFTGTGVTCFSISKDGGLKSGSYQIKVVLDSKVLRTQDFTVGS
jgi:hypothetical protein